MREFAPIIPPGLESELISSFVIIVASLLVYFGTRELYELSSHKGIKFFRQAFLFFAIAFFFRSFIKFIVRYLNVKDIIEFSPRAFGPLTLFLFIYFSSMAIFYLLYSVMWKKWGDSSRIYIFHFLAIILGVLVSTSRDLAVHLSINIFLFLLVLVVVYISYRESKTRKNPHNPFIIYLLLLVFCILNIFDTLLPRFLNSYRLLLSLISIGIFMLILYKVIKRAGN